MTVVAWDGKVLAADRRATLGTLIRTTTKIHRMENGDLCAYAGDAAAGEELLAWFRSGADQARFPIDRRKDDPWASLLVIRKRPRAILKYETTPYPLTFKDKTFAIGSGRDFALAAMACGRSAIKAVELAAKFDSGCGNGVDWERL